MLSGRVASPAAHPSSAPRRVAASAAVLDRPGAAPAPGPTLLNGAVLHSATQHQLEVIHSMQPFFEERVLPLLTPVEELWQPSDFLPDPASPAFRDDLLDLRARAAGLPEELLLCLVGDMITEEALPTYMAMLNTLDGVRDETGRAQHAYARWTRHWIAEENRHGDLLNKYLWLTGRVDMRAVERTIQQLIGAGMDPQTENNPYLCFVFTAFQERATKLSHGATARLAKAAGDEALARVCGAIAADEGRHEQAYTRTVDAIFQKDPSGAVLAFADMMRKRIVMPAHLMDDGRHGAANPGRTLFDDFSAVAEDIGVYTAADYVDIVEHLVQRWDVRRLGGLSPEAQKAQDYLCALPSRFRRLAERKAAKKTRAPRTPVAFSWLGGRRLELL